MNSLSKADFDQLMASYIDNGIKRADLLGNRGPVKFDEHGRLTPEILEAYRETGFYVFEGLVSPSETDLLATEAMDLLERAPVTNDALLDKHGRPAFGLDFAKPAYTLVTPLSDPFGGTAALNGRHQVQMLQPKPDPSAPSAVVLAMHGLCQIMESGLRLYGHPALLSIAASVNGDDFVPYTEVVFVKQPGVGGSVSWHQDGVTHWQSQNWDEDIHGFNFQVQLFDTSARSCLWVVPGSHKRGKIDIKKLVAEEGSDRLSDAVPLYAKAGDVTMVNRQALHGSFANTSDELRISPTIGFHKRSSVLGAPAALLTTGAESYDEAWVSERSKVLGYAISARAAFYQEEKPFHYVPLNMQPELMTLAPANWKQALMNYNLRDIAI